MAVAANFGRLVGAVLANVALLAAASASHGGSVRAVTTHVALLTAALALAIERLGRLGAIGLVVAVDNVSRP